MNSTAILEAQEGMCFMFVLVFQSNTAVRNIWFYL